MSSQNVVTMRAIADLQSVGRLRRRFWETSTASRSQLGGIEVERGRVGEKNRKMEDDLNSRRRQTAGKSMMSNSEGRNRFSALS